MKNTVLGWRFPFSLSKSNIITAINDTAKFVQTIWNFVLLLFSYIAVVPAAVAVVPILPIAKSRSEDSNKLCLPFFLLYVFVGLPVILSSFFSRPPCGNEMTTKRACPSIGYSVGLFVRWFSLFGPLGRTCGCVSVSLSGFFFLFFPSDSLLIL